MKRIALFLMVLLLSISAGCTGHISGGEVNIPSITTPDDNGSPPQSPNTENTIEAVIDADFQRGFGIMGIDSVIDGTAIKTNIKFGKAETIWRIAQWGSRYNLNSPTQSILNATTMVQADKSKRVELDRTASKLTLALDTTKEYDTSQSSRMMWAHLLIEQDLNSFKSYRLDTFSALTTTLNFNVTKANKGTIETKPANKTLPAQLSSVFYIVNHNTMSMGYGSFLWFVLNFVDTRYPVTTTSFLRDFAGGNAGNFIYTLGADTLMDNSPFEVGREYKINFNMLPYISQALDKAAEKGFMMGTQLSDCVVTGMNIGWELPGAWDVSVTFNNISLKGILK